MRAYNLTHEECVCVCVDDGERGSPVLEQRTYLQRLGMIVFCGFSQLSSLLHQPLHR